MGVMTIAAARQKVTIHSVRHARQGVAQGAFDQLSSSSACVQADSICQA